MATRTLIAKLAFSPMSSLRILRPSFLLRLRPLTSSTFLRLPIAAASGGGASFSTRPATSSLNDPSPNWSNRPPKETILLDGCDFEHWLVVLEPPEPSLTRDDIIDSYIKTLAEVLGSEEEAKKSIYSVSTKHYFAFGCIVSEELSYKIKTLPKVRWVLPDSYLDVRNKDYGGEPFIDGRAVPYDPKYHEEWVRNNARANERSRRNDRPRNFDRSRNFERRRENMQNFQNREAPPMPNQGFQASPPPPQNATTPPQNATSPPPPPPNVGYQNQMPNPNFQGSAPGYQGVNQGYQGGVNQGYPGGGNQGYPGGGNQGYQAGGNPGGSMPGGPGYQVNNSYQGGGPGYQGGAPPAYGDNNFQRGGAPGYQGGGAGAGPVHGQTGGPPSYQGGAGPNFQTGGPAGPGYQGSPNYQADGPGYQSRDLPGRDQ